MRDTNKFLFTLTSNYKKGIIACFYLFDLFKDPLIIPLNCDGFQYAGNTSIIGINPIIILESMQIAIVYYHSLGKVIKFAKTLYL